MTPACTRLTALTLGFLIVGTSSFAQTRRGLSEVSFTASLQSLHSDLITDTSTQIVASYGLFATSRLEVGPRVQVMKGEDADAFGTVAAFGAFHFAKAGSKVVPYAGGQAGRTFGMGSDYLDNKTSYGVFGGLKIFMAGGGGAITVEPFWSRQSAHSKILDDDFNVTIFGIGAGVSVFF